LIPRGVKAPKGSGDRRSGKSKQQAELQRARSEEAAEAGANWRRLAASRRARCSARDNRITVVGGAGEP